MRSQRPIPSAGQDRGCRRHREGTAGYGVHVQRTGAGIENLADEADLEDVYNTERHLLYVACTRARERLLVTGVDPASEFLDDLTAA